MPLVPLKECQAILCAFMDEHPQKWARYPAPATGHPLAEVWVTLVLLGTGHPLTKGSTREVQMIPLATIIGSVLGLVDKIGGVFVASQTGKLSRSRLVAGLTCGLLVGCAIHSGDSQEFAMCVRSTVSTVGGVVGSTNDE